MLSEIVLDTDNKFSQVPIAANKFSGPFDLLLHLVDEKKLELNDLSLREVIHSFLNYFHQMEKMDVDLAADFLLVAAYLVAEKSRALLPVDKFELNLEEDSEEISRKLVAHLMEYEVFKNLAVSLKERKEIFEKVYARHQVVSPPPLKRDIHLKDVTMHDLVEAFQRVWQQAQTRENVSEINDEPITVKDKIEQILLQIEANAEGVVFEALFSRVTRLEIVVTFIAILELIKLRKISIRQEGSFGQIYIFKK